MIWFLPNEVHIHSFIPLFPYFQLLYGDGFRGAEEKGGEERDVERIVRKGIDGSEMGFIMV